MHGCKNSLKRKKDNTHKYKWEQNGKCNRKKIQNSMYTTEEILFTLITVYIYSLMKEA